MFSGRQRTLLVVLLCLAMGSRVSGSPARAQEPIDCPEPSPAASPAATEPGAAPPPADASPIVFPAGGGDLTVFAAASLTDAFIAIKSDLEAANAGLTITYNFAGSQALVTQLVEGAEADVFASANRRQMQNAIEAGAIADEPVDFTQNRLAIVVPADNPAGITGLADLATGDVDLVLAAPEVPVGQYAREAACKAAADPATYGEGFLDGFAGNVVSNEDNVKAVLAKVQLGEADAGIVYTADVTADVEDDVLLIEIAEAVNVVATYPIAPVAGGDADLAAGFIAYVLGPDGQATLQEFRFEPRPAG
jgi:molybdate transport system substrate-binding protein